MLQQGKYILWKNTAFSKNLFLRNYTGLRNYVYLNTSGSFFCFFFFSMYFAIYTQKEKRIMSHVNII